MGGGTREELGGPAVSRLSSTAPVAVTASLQEEMRRGGRGRMDAIHKAGITGAPGMGDASRLIKSSRHLL